MSYIGYKAQGMGFDAHLTVLYLGHDFLDPDIESEIQDFFKSEICQSPEIRVMRSHIDMFGPRRDLPVLRVMAPPGLHWIRTMAVKKFGNVSEFLDWNPHITLDFVHTDTINLPFHIKLTDLDLY